MQVKESRGLSQNEGGDSWFRRCEFSLKGELVSGVELKKFRRVSSFVFRIMRSLEK